MKRSLQFTLILACAILCAAIPSCKTPEANARLAEIVRLSVAIAESRGAISAQDAADIRAAETIVLPPAAKVETTSGK